MVMDVSDLRKRILRALDEARKDTSARRQNVDQASAAYQQFLTGVAVPLFMQAANVLRAEGHPFSVHTPADSVRLASDRASQDFIELELDASTPQPQVLGRTTMARGGKGLAVDERPLAPGKAIQELTEDDVAQFLMTEIRRLVTRT
jgi:hypothetical protein